MVLIRVLWKALRNIGLLTWAIHIVLTNQLNTQVNFYYSFVDI